MRCARSSHGPRCAAGGVYAQLVRRQLQPGGAAPGGGEPAVPPGPFAAAAFDPSSPASPEDQLLASFGDAAAAAGEDGSAVVADAQARALIVIVQEQGWNSWLAVRCMGPASAVKPGAVRRCEGSMYEAVELPVNQLRRRLRSRCCGEAESGMCARAGAHAAAAAAVHARPGGRPARRHGRPARAAHAPARAAGQRARPAPRRARRRQQRRRGPERCGGLSDVAEAHDDSGQRQAD